MAVVSPTIHSSRPPALLGWAPRGRRPTRCQPRARPSPPGLPSPPELVLCLSASYRLMTKLIYVPGGKKKRKTNPRTSRSIEIRKLDHSQSPHHCQYSGVFSCGFLSVNTHKGYKQLGLHHLSGFHVCLYLIFPQHVSTPLKAHSDASTFPVGVRPC